MFLTACGTTVESNNINTTPDTPKPDTPKPDTLNNLLNSNKLGKLQISDDRRMIEYEDGTGFFWMGDTAWKMPSKSTEKDVIEYMKDRQQRGFNVIQISAVMIKYSNGNYGPNVNNDSPFTDNNILAPNEKFWKHIDFMIDEAEKNNLYVALLPAWHNVISKESDAKNYGIFIANRYKNKKNIIWVVGGDSNAADPSVQKIWNTLGEEIQNVVGQSQLISYHPSGGKSSSQWFKDAQWLDFHMIQSGHCGSIDNANKLLTSVYNKSKPVLDAEPRYEDIHSCFSNKDLLGDRFTADEVREIAYKQIFSGAMGHTYGHHSIWQKYKNGDGDAGIPLSKASKIWEDALSDDGGSQMGHLAKLMRSRPLLNRIPDQSMIQNGNAIATRGVGYAFIYFPKGGSVTINLAKIGGTQVKAWWFDPKTGDATEIDTYNNSTQTFTTRDTDDIVLVLDDIAKAYETPGK